MIDREAVWIDTASITPGTDDDNPAVAVAVEVDNDDYLLLFEYAIVTGDSAGDLDYWADDQASKIRLHLVGEILCFRRKYSIVW